jgi:hypothetical protein
MQGIVNMIFRSLHVYSSADYRETLWPVKKPFACSGTVTALSVCRVSPSPQSTPKPSALRPADATITNPNGDPKQPRHTVFDLSTDISHMTSAPRPSRPFRADAPIVCEVSVVIRREERN